MGNCSGKYIRWFWNSLSISIRLLFGSAAAYFLIRIPVGKIFFEDLCIRSWKDVIQVNLCQKLLFFINFCGLLRKLRTLNFVTLCRFLDYLVRAKRIILSWYEYNHYHPPLFSYFLLWFIQDKFNLEHLFIQAFFIYLLQFDRINFFPRQLRLSFQWQDGITKSYR